MNGWIIGFGIGAVVVVIVVVLLLLMIVGARNVATKAEEILAALYEARDNTQALWRVSDTNATATRIVVAATGAREHLEGNSDE